MKLQAQNAMSRERNLLKNACYSRIDVLFELKAPNHFKMKDIT